MKKSERPTKLSQIQMSAQADVHLGLNIRGQKRLALLVALDWLEVSLNFANHSSARWPWLSCAPASHLLLCRRHPLEIDLHTILPGLLGGSRAYDNRLY
jgi:hypothetical protein